jgi:hypothetical protein
MTAMASAARAGVSSTVIQLSTFMTALRRFGQSDSQAQLALAAEAMAVIDARLARLTDAERGAFWASIRKAYNTPYNDPEKPAQPKPVEPAPGTRIGEPCEASVNDRHGLRRQGRRLLDGDPTLNVHDGRAGARHHSVGGRDPSSGDRSVDRPARGRARFGDARRGDGTDGRVGPLHAPSR